VSCGPSGLRLREFDTSCDAVGEKTVGGIPTSFSLTTRQSTHIQGAPADPAGRHIPPEQMPTICADAQRGESLCAVAVDYGASHETIRHILHGSASSIRTRRTRPPYGTSPPRIGAT
jgi:hypothetical protein